MKPVFITLISLFLSTTLFAQAPTNGLVAYYPFSSNANDASEITTMAPYMVTLYLLQIAKVIRIVHISSLMAAKSVLVIAHHFNSQKAFHIVPGLGYVHLKATMAILAHLLRLVIM